MIDAYLPEIFLTLMGFAVLLYAILDGYDLGVGMLLPMNNESQRDTMISSIGPFWDANETWLVLAVGILLIAFPKAHGLVFEALYFPTFLLLVGLIFRGVSFDFRAKAKDHHKYRWDLLFRLGSWLAALMQGYMLGRYVTGFQEGFFAYAFAVLSALCVSAAYAYIGGAWLVMKTTGDIQKHGAIWARRAGWFAAVGMLAVSITNPLISAEVATRWLSMPAVFLLVPIPLMCLVLLITVDRYLAHVPTRNDIGCWFPFVAVAFLFLLNFVGLAYSYFPDVVPGLLTAKDAASATESLRVIFYGVAVVLPFILLYTIFAYRVFWGKTQKLSYY
jgi:cytochrome d ubiquinol oxidase subunit II